MMTESDGRPTDADDAADIARDHLSSSQGFWSPTLSVSARQSYVSQPGQFAPQKYNVDYPYELTQDKFSAIVSGELPVGLSYSLGTTTGFEKARTDFRSDAEVSTYYAGGIRDTNDYFAETSLTLRQHLLKDFHPRLHCRFNDREGLRLRNHHELNLSWIAIDPTRRISNAIKGAMIALPNGVYKLIHEVIIIRRVLGLL